ncbi:phospholipid/cholesterol/gamma-HCH transport system substrate-binding protein [Actinocorallia herbida]|uniref:Phospholipid/cholesterol/gamma-HCH transport system substrate-binding protein n=1 Tax=Actinocorallia herbida TaxID=58109 RepID=A0A3N1CXC4_9ACTN|nr:MlaD family protein [Actinocorallia herbida]ROO85952.1 phospholipid/cholesterol/gamma-HCH transport system substrate-binding protein [Actinocorallia herbida]
MALKSFRDRDQAVVGVASLLVIVVGLVAVFLAGSTGLLHDRYTVTGVFAGTGGLHEGNEVRVAGIKVGEVTAVEPDFAQGLVRIAWKVDSKVNLGPQTRAEISTSNILGGRYLRLSGPVSEPYLADLPEGERAIPQDRTRLPVTAGDVISTGTKTLGQLDAKLIGDVIDKLGGISPRTRERLADALHGLTQLADALENSGPELRELVNSADRLLTVVTAKDAQLSRLAKGIQALLDQLRDREAELAVLFGSGSSAVTRLSKLIDTQQQALIDLIDDLGGTVETLRPGLDDMNTTLAWLGPAMGAFSTIGSYGPWLDAVGTQIGPVAPEDLAELLGGKK